MGARLMAIVAEGQRSRVYLTPKESLETLAHEAKPTWKPDTRSRGTWAGNAQGRRYGFQTFGDYFTPRQLVTLTTLSDLLQEVRERVRCDAISTGVPDDGKGLNEGGTLATAYGDAVAVYLAFSVDRIANYGSSLCTWHWGIKYETVTSTFGRQAIPMTWDYAEGNPFSDSSGNWEGGIDWIARVFSTFAANSPGYSVQSDASTTSSVVKKVVSTDPP